VRFYRRKLTPERIFSARNCGWFDGWGVICVTDGIYPTSGLGTDLVKERRVLPEVGIVGIVDARSAVVLPEPWC
jgi:hypothetical protein